MVQDAFNDFRTTGEPPLDIVLPPSVTAVYDTIKAFEEQQGRSCKGGFYFGGVFTSILRDEAPRDIDIAVHAPELYELADLWSERQSRTAGNYKERQEIREDMEFFMDQMFPYSSRIFFNEENLTSVRTCPTIGPCFLVTATSVIEGRATPVDVLFMKDEIDPLKMLIRTEDAPIRKVGFFTETGEYTFHKKFPDHAERWVFEPTDPDTIKEDILEKAREKGMQIVL